MIISRIRPVIAPFSHDLSSVSIISSHMRPSKLTTQPLRTPSNLPSLMLLNLRQPRLLRRLPLQPQHMLPRLSHRRPRLHKRTVSLPLRLLRCMNTLPCLDDTRVLMLFSREQTTAGVAGAFGVAAEDAAGGLLFAVAGGDGGDGITAAAAGEETAAGFLVRGGSGW